MTMPRLMNCNHSDDGWCLSCVRELYEERRPDIRPAVEKFTRLMEKNLRENHQKVSLPRPTAGECLGKIDWHSKFIREAATERCQSESERDRDDLLERIEQRSAHLANWLMMLCEWDINAE